MAEMDPERVRAYLQVACAGLGFEIGEVWWTSSEKGHSTVASIEEQSCDGSIKGNGMPKRKQFVQLYTSKAYENRREELVNPPSGGEMKFGMTRSDSLELNKHVLSPRLVDAIAQTTQVVWANSKSQEGLLGRSDLPLQTAVGMPVAMDDEGNMCVVVMFSTDNVQSTDDALEYLQSISQSATSSTIPCLMPVLNPDSSMQGLQRLTHDIQAHHNMSHSPNALGPDVMARFVSLDEHHSPHAEDHELTTAPKDSFGIPMLPTNAELGSVLPQQIDEADIFDDFSYGIWTTIMETPGNGTMAIDTADATNPFNFDLQSDLINGNETLFIEGSSTTTSNSNHLTPQGTLPQQYQQLTLPPQIELSEERKTRLEEFCSAFIDMSVFDLADVWVPSKDYPDCLRHVTSVATMNNSLLYEFQQSSQLALVKFWTGAVGRAYSSGNPVWSANPEIFVDPGRSDAFGRSKICTVMAVPVFADKQTLPACVVACYSLVRSGAVPFVLKFVQQALRLLWQGLDKIQPHSSIGDNVWRGLAPADLGEMAADLEMQQHFMIRKRPRSNSVAVSLVNNYSSTDAKTSELASQLETISLPDREYVDIPVALPHSVAPSFDAARVQQHITDAVRSVANAVRLEDHFSSSNIVHPHQLQPQYLCRNTVDPPARLPMGHPLPMPQRFPTTIITSSMSPPHKRLQTKEPNMIQIAHPSAKSILASTYPHHEQPGQSLYTNKEANQDLYSPMPFSSMLSSEPQILRKSTPDRANIRAPISESNGMLSSEGNQSDTNAKCQETVCRIQGCTESVVSPRPYCIKHSGNRLCEHEGCPKCAQGSTRFCIAHGGGRRCTFPGCEKGARDKFFCAAHGGGKRCIYKDCSKSAVGGSTLCTSHGGGRRCSVAGCDKSAQSSTRFCVKHGGGKKCAQEGCEKVARGRTLFCAAHGGGVRCKLEGCNRVAIGKFQLCRAHGGGSSRAKTLPEPQQVSISSTSGLKKVSEVQQQQHEIRHMKHNNFA